MFVYSYSIMLIILAIWLKREIYNEDYYSPTHSYHFRKVNTVGPKNNLHMYYQGIHINNNPRQLTKLTGVSDANRRK